MESFLIFEWDQIYTSGTVTLCSLGTNSAIILKSLMNSSCCRSLLRRKATFFGLTLLCQIASDLTLMRLTMLNMKTQSANHHKTFFMQFARQNYHCHKSTLLVPHPFKSSQLDKLHLIMLKNLTSERQCR